MSSPLRVPARWSPYFEPYIFISDEKPSDFREKAAKIDWAMEHVIFGGDDFWTEKGIARAWFDGREDRFNNIHEAIRWHALNQYGVYGFNISHGPHLEKPALVDFGGGLGVFAKYVIDHDFEFLDWLKEVHGEDAAIATTACLELTLVEIDRWGMSHVYVPSNYRNFGVYIWNEAAYDYRAGKVLLEKVLHDLINPVTLIRL